MVADKSDKQTFDRREFSWLEFLDTAKAQGASYAVRRNGDYTDGPDGFYRASFNEALKMGYEDGWMPQSPNVADLLAYVETDLKEATVNGFDWTFSTSGMRVNVARYLSNNPDCMVKALPLKVMRTGRVIRLYVPATYPGSADSVQIISRGIAIMALVEAFSMMQHPTEIWAGICNEGGSRRGERLRTSYLVNVQQATDPLDMPRIMFALAHPAFARQLGWSVKDTCPGNRGEAMGFRGGNYGRSSREIIPADYGDMADENVIVLPSIDKDRMDWTNEPKVVAWIKAQLKRIEEGQV